MQSSIMTNETPDDKMIAICDTRQFLNNQDLLMEFYHSDRHDEAFMQLGLYYENVRVDIEEADVPTRNDIFTTYLGGHIIINNFGNPFVTYIINSRRHVDNSLAIVKYEPKPKLIASVTRKLEMLDLRKLYVHQRDNFMARWGILQGIGGPATLSYGY